MQKLISYALCGALVCGQYTPNKAIDAQDLQKFARFLGEFTAIIAATTVSVYIQIKLMQYLIGKHTWKIHKKGTVKEGFSSVAGNDIAKAELQDIIRTYAWFESYVWDLLKIKKCSNFRYRSQKKGTLNAFHKSESSIPRNTSFTMSEICRRTFALSKKKSLYQSCRKRE